MVDVAFNIQQVYEHTWLECVRIYWEISVYKQMLCTELKIKWDMWLICVQESHNLAGGINEWFYSPENIWENEGNRTQRSQTSNEYKGLNYQIYILKYIIWISANICSKQQIIYIFLWKPLQMLSNTMKVHEINTGEIFHYPPGIYMLD